MNVMPVPDPWQNESLLFNLTAGNSSSTYTPLMLPAINKAISIILVTSLTITMVSLGSTIELSKLKGHIMRPKGVAIAVISQYGVMPLTAFCLVKVFQLSEIRAVVVLICGCCPGGNLSNIMTLALKGDMNLSIVMTTCSTILALGMMPLLLYVYCHGFPNLHGLVPFRDILIALVMILFPCGTGVLINYYRPQYAQTFRRIGLSMMVIAVLTIGILASVGVGGSILTVLAPPLMATGSLMPLIGYTFGYGIAALFKLSQAECRTVAMETGCQNVQLCTTILKLAFLPEIIGPLFVFPLVFASLQIIEASVLIVLFNCHQWFMGKKKETYQSADTAEKQEEESKGKTSRTTEHPII